MNRSRTFLKMLLVMACLSILAAVMTGSAAAETDEYLNVNFHPFTLDEDNTTCVEFDDDDIGPTSNCDPVNLVFPGRTWQQVRDLLLLLNDDWSTSGGGSNQWLHYDGAQLYMENEQLYKPGTIFGPRYHIRLWQAPGDILVTFAAVHHEDFFHNIDEDWEQAEADVANALCGSDCGEPAPLPVQIGMQGPDEEWRGWLNDGLATVIPDPGTSDDPPEVTIFMPAVGSTVSDVTPVEIGAVDDNDPAGTLGVDWRIEGGDWLPTTYNSSSGYYEASWDTTAVTDGDYLFYAQATDSAQNTAGVSQPVTVDNPNLPPSAGFSFNCNGLSCEFDASASSDPDGTIVTYDWDFGDAEGASALVASHTYAAAGTYPVTLTVTDNEGATGTENQNVTVADSTASTMHVGDLEGASIVKKNWSAQVMITVHDAVEGLVSAATVSGFWSDGASGTGTCITDGGVCTVAIAELSKKSVPSVIFTVTNIEHDLSYDPTRNHDPQGDSSGTAIQVYKDGTTQDPGQPPQLPPVASFTYDCPDLACTFDAAGSYDPDGGEIAAYAWDFGDGAGANGPTANHTFAPGTYQVTLMITDDEGSTAADQQSISVGQAADLTLTAVGYKVKGVHHVDLTWSGAASENVDIYRDDRLVATSGSNSYTDITYQKGGASYLYKVCDQDTAVCSEEVTVTF